jgi:hypothetical protein
VNPPKSAYVSSGKPYSTGRGWLTRDTGLPARKHLFMSNQNHRMLPLIATAQPSNATTFRNLSRWPWSAVLFRRKQASLTTGAGMEWTSRRSRAWDTPHPGGTRRFVQL